MSKLAYTLEEAAEACGVSQDTVKKQINAGALRAKRTSTNADGDPAGKYLITAAALAAWLDGLVDA